VAERHWIRVLGVPLANNSSEVGKLGRPIRILPWWAVSLGLLLMIGSTTVVMLWLLREADGDPGRRIEAIKAGFTVGLGASGVLALLLAVRRQWLQERTQVHAEQIAADNAGRAERIAADTRFDAAEKRLTELYIKAADQLGSGKAPVRLAGLYALERLAQDNPAHRQTVVDVICAYLRMPFASPPLSMRAEQPVPADDDVWQRSEVPSRDNASAAAHEELQVRQAAQRILVAHLRVDVEGDRTAATPPAPAACPRYWNVSIDLTQASLVDVDFASCRFNSAARFGGATFIGDARFGKAFFVGAAWFREATFTGAARFEKTAFGGAARFSRASYAGPARFAGASFSGYAWFREATFAGDARFETATFHRMADFDEATFNIDARFTGTLIAASPDNGQSIWPTGWALDPAVDGWHGLVPVDRGAGQPETGQRNDLPPPHG
jgi:Pentapeptide repeats (9 copies)